MLDSALSTAADEAIIGQKPYTFEVTIEGVSTLLLHAWNNESVAAKADAKKGSATKKSDDVESYVYRDEEGFICIPGEYLRQSLIKSAKNYADPRSPRKSLMDLCSASVVCAEDAKSPILSSVDGQPTMVWDKIDQRRVVVMRAAITRSRPAFLKGYRATFRFMVLVPEYFELALIRSMLTDAGRYVGIGDFRPSFGRFDVVHIEQVQL